MADTTNLLLPLIAAAQAQKHVTHNEALQKLDALVQMTVLAVQADPPASPQEGERFICDAAATGGWQGQDGKIAAWQSGGWVFYQPLTGWRTWVADEAAFKVFDGSGWVGLGGGTSDLQNLSEIGINATADATNRLSVSSPNTLLNHEGDDHRVKINRATSADTASVLFQTDFSGRAEFGNTGDDKFRLRVSDDGATWRDALAIDSATALAQVTLEQPPVPTQFIANAPVAEDVWLAPYGFWGRAIGNLNLSEPDKRYKLPVFVPYDFVYSETQIKVSTAGVAGTNARWGLRRWDTTKGWAGFGQLLWQTNAVDVSSSGDKLQPVASVPVKAGWYVFELAYSNAIGLEGVSYAAGLCPPLFGFKSMASGFDPVNFVCNADVATTNAVTSGLPADDTGVIPEAVQFNRGSVLIAMR